MERDALEGGRRGRGTGLLLAGGGARGAYQVGVLKAIAEFWDERRNPFPVICGVSVGSINAAYIASRAGDFRRGVTDLDQLWRGLRTHKVYRTDFPSTVLSALHWLVTLTLGGFGRANPLSLLRNGPLERLLRRDIDFHDITTCLRSGALEALAITASSYGTGRAMTFFQGDSSLADWTRARRDGIGCEITVDHLLASSALPIIFPPRRLGGQFFGDGSLRLTSPLSPAIHLGADRILVVGTRDTRPVAPPAGTMVPQAPSLGDIAGHLLDLLFNDNLNEDVERLRRINRTLSLVPPEKRGQTPLRTIDVLIQQPSGDIAEVAGRHVREIPRTIRMLLRGAGAWGSNWRVPSYLLFEPGYCGELIDMGYTDALARREEITDFLMGTAPVSLPEDDGSQRAIP
ncbi:MAG: patatin-like phospholipase family protein [Alphaproteobacteria bacterium]|nr:patatin-like phospholipase family protein [Alphaproteobacteria bacterium]